MNKVKVQLVKYDMTKTKNRNRKDMLVDFQTEGSVITQLERIHKGEKVVKIHEIVWDENQIKEAIRQSKMEQEELFFGRVKFFDPEKGFGFIQPDEDMEDLFFHATACIGDAPNDKDHVEFKVSEGKKGLTAIAVRVMESDEGPE